MVRRTTAWPVGTPCWLDLMTPDPAAARTYYGELFGWTFDVGGEESHGYSLARLGGDSVAGIHGIASPAAWNTYLATADADATAEAIVQAGGRVDLGPIDVPGHSRLLLAHDAVGAAFGAWQARESVGCARVDEPGAFVWTELLTDEPDRAEAFYADVFAVSFTPIGGDDFRFSTMQVSEPVDPRVPVGGIGGAEVATAYWRSYFAAPDVDAHVAAALDLGATVVQPAHDTPFGRWAQLDDPGGATYAVITPPDPPA